VRDPRILVLDEPTTGLDSDNEAKVISGLRVLMEGRTTIVMTHSMDLAATADQVIRLHDGRIVAHDPRPLAIADRTAGER